MDLYRTDESGPLKEVRIDLNIIFPLSRDSALLKDSRNRASRFASATIDTLIGIDVELFVIIIPGFIGCRMNTVHGANIYTGCVFRTDAWLCDDIGHIIYIPFSLQHVDRKIWIAGILPPIEAKSKGLVYLIAALKQAEGGSTANIQDRSTLSYLYFNT